MNARARWLKLFILLVAISILCFLYLTDQNQNKKSLIRVSVDSGQASSPINGEERARHVRERCLQYPELKTCVYPSRGIAKRMLPVVHKKFAMCVLGKTGSSNWKTLILQEKGVINEEEVKNMTYPHDKKYWEDKGTVYYYKNPERKEIINTINNDFYKVTFVRDPLSRLLSAYRDKFTGTSQDHQFKVYRLRRTVEMCSCLEDLLLIKPDGDLIPNEIYSYMEEQLNQHCKGKKFVSLGIFFLIFIFMPQDFKGDVLKDLTVNTHFNDMLSMCDHCRINYDFIGTVETMGSDFEFLKDKLGIEHNLPKIESTQQGVMSKEKVAAMWKDIPHLLKQYIFLFLGNDAKAFGYNGYDVDMSKDLLPNHYEKRTKCARTF